jgi:tetratricopeptide (TPR) repeat protein
MAAASAAFRDGDLAAALRHLEQAAAQAPGRGEPQRLRGLVLLADEQPARAVDALRAAVRLSPGDERARLALAEALMKSERHDEAARALAQTIDAMPASGRARYRVARVFERQGRYPEAIRALEEAASLGPLIAENAIHETIGSLHLARQDVAAAQAAFERRVDILPNDAGAHHALGDAYAQQGRFDPALTEFAIAAMLDPASPAVHASVAQTHLADGGYEGAVSAARRALSLEPRHKEAQYALATALIRLGRAEEGARALEVFAELQAEESAAKARQFELGALRREAAVSAAQQDHAREVELLRQALALDAASPAAHLDLGLALVRAGHAAEAIERISQAIVAGAGAGAYRHLADAYRAAGRTDESRKAMAVFEGLRRDALRRAGANR